MPTKKKGLARKLRSSPKGWKSRNKLREYVKVLDKKVPLLIRSSGRNQSLSKSFPKIRDIPSSKDLDSNFFSRNEIKDIFLRDNNPFDSTNIDVKEYSEDIAHHVLDTIFSPAFHISRYVAGGTGNRVDFIKFFGCDEEQIYENRKIWKSQHSKFENVDEASEDTMSIEFRTEPEQSEEIHDFDSYLFIKKLPDLSLVVPTFRPMLLPKKTRSCPPTTLVLDLDETLVHSELEPISDPDITFSIKFDLMEEMVYVRCRPHLNDFLERVANLFEVVIFTASQKIYAEQLLNILDPKRKLFRHRAYRESCIFVKGNYLKDLSVLGRDLARVIIIDNSPEAFGFQVNNGIPIKSWFNDHLDQELLLLLPFLESLARVEDVRPLIEEKYNLQENIAAAVILHSTLSK